MAIVTTAQYKAYRGISVTTYDALIDILVASADAMAARFCGYAPIATAAPTFSYTTAITELVSGNGSACIQLRQPPISTITSVTETFPGSSSTVVLTTDEYSFDAKSGILTRDGSQRGRFPSVYIDDFGDTEAVAATTWGDFPNWHEGQNNYTIVYAGGYGGAGSFPTPGDLSMAMYQLLDLMYARTWAAGYVPGPYKSEKLGDHSYERALAIGANANLFTDQIGGNHVRELFSAFVMTGQGVVL